MKVISFLGAVFVLFATQAGASDNKWAIHEWGTFTSLQNENGEAIGGINTDDEPVPGFVHRLAYFLLLQPTEIPSSFCQGAPHCHPDVTMRLETPVIYFHPPSGQSSVEKADIKVKFRGGWLTEYYPYAEPSAPGLRAEGYTETNLVGRFFPFGPLHSDTESTLEWNGLKIGGDWPMTNTTAHVWTSPRAVQCASVRTDSSEAEKFLFYRGVGHIDAPMTVSRDVNSGELLFRSQLKDLPVKGPLALHSLWLVEIRDDGRVAFRTLPPVTLDHNAKKIVAHTADSFQSGDFSAGNLKKLKAELRGALVADGLFADEAQALLNTWELSYFKSAGLRVFFLVPRAWTDFYLPLECSLPADINRVMVGRIELITPEQRQNLAELSHFSPQTIEADRGLLWTNFMAGVAYKQGEFERLYSEKKSLSTDISIPGTYEAYLDLGRFRNALILDEEKRRPTPGLAALISNYGLQAYKPVAALPTTQAGINSLIKTLSGASSASSQ